MYLLIFINVILLVAGQILWKLGANNIDFKLSIEGICNIIFNPYIVGGGVLYILATFIWIYILSNFQLSKVYPMQSLCYIGGIIGGILVFNEKVSILGFVGVFFIILGVLIISIS